MKNILKWGKATMALCTILFITGTISSCDQFKDSDYDIQAKADDQRINKYLTDNNIQASKQSTGFYYQVLTSNDAGTSLVQDNVVDFYYKVSLLDGTVLEDSISAKKPARFKLLNNTMVPEALDKGISLMKVGAKYRFFIPSNLAYGDYRSSSFPAKSIFIIDVQTAKAQSETDIEVTQLDSIDHFVKSKFQHYEKFASGLYYIDSIVGTGAKPHNGDRVTINFTRKYLDGTIIKSVNGLSLDIGYGQAVQGLEEGLEQMRVGGKAVLIMPASIAFKQSLCVLPQKTRKDLLDDQMINSEVSPYSIVEYIVELKSVN